MEPKAALILLVIIVFTPRKVQCKVENIKYFLTNYSVTNITEVEPRRVKIVSFGDEDTGKSIKITAFGKTFILDLSTYFVRDDTELSYISKLKNVSDSFMSSKSLLYYGYVRAVKNSYVVGYFSKDKHFQGYVLTDEVYCIEPYGGKKFHIVYRFKDVIVPGCSKFSDDAQLDCTETRYFEPWRPNKPPKIQIPSQKYSLFYDRYFEYFNQQQSLNSTKPPPAAKTTSKSDKAKKKDEKGSKDKSKEEDCVPHRGHKDCKIKSFDKQDLRREENVLDQIHSADYKNDSRNVTSMDRNSEHARTNFIENISSILESSGLWKDNLNVANEKYNNYKTKNKDADVHSSIMETLEESVSEIQCNVEIVIGKSLRQKYGDWDEDVMKDIHTQFHLLNEIFRKVTLYRKGAPMHLSLNVEKMTIYADEVYSPFNLNTDLEYFTKTHEQVRQFCLVIGMVNRFLKSGQFFDGYIPQGGGGACAKSGNTLIVSHGNENTPAPMALYFAALIRGITRGLGAGDEDPQCMQGSYPNPMKVLQDYLLNPEINPTKDYSIFTTCNIDEISNALRRRECFLLIQDPLCGNGIVDKGEQCDCGPAYHCRRVDECCNPPHTMISGQKKGLLKGCTLIKGAKCSTSQECCSACQIDTNKHICYSGNDECDIAICDGKSAVCPNTTAASEGIICSRGNATSGPRICRSKKCELGLCAAYGLKPCTCASGTFRDCLYCCIKEGKCKAAGKDLKLMEGRGYFKPDGVECMGGTCQDGNCSYDDGMDQAPKHTVRKAPKFRTKLSGSGYLYPELKFLVGSMLSFLLLLLLE